MGRAAPRNWVPWSDRPLPYPVAASCRRMVGQVQDRHGKLDILVNNAGIQFVSSVQDFPEDKWDAIVQVVMNAPFHASKAALPAMLEQGWGRIVNTGMFQSCAGVGQLGCCIRVCVCWGGGQFGVKVFVG